MLTPQPKSPSGPGPYVGFVVIAVVVIALLALGMWRTAHGVWSNPQGANGFGPGWRCQGTAMRPGICVRDPAPAPPQPPTKR